MYVTSSLSLTTTGFFLCLYVAVVPVNNVVSSITGILVFVKVSLFTAVMYFLNAKSNSSSFDINSTVNNCGSCVISTSGCSAFSSIPFASSVPCSHNFFGVSDLC